MSRPRLLPIALLAVVAVASFAAGSVTRAQTPAVSAGHSRPTAGRAGWSDTARIYSEEQATAGQATWTKVCAECHESVDVTGPDFKTKWRGQSVFALFEQIRTTMPDGNPGTLSREEYAATVAYILKLNGLPAGEKAMPTDSASLAAFTLDLPAGSR